MIQNNLEKGFRYSIRKRSIGVCGVVIATFLLSTASIIQKYNHEKKVQLTFVDETHTQIAFEELGQTDLAQVVAIHSCEPTLEEIFIQLTGEKLND